MVSIFNNKIALKNKQNAEKINRKNYNLTS